MGKGHGKQGDPLGAPTGEEPTQRDGPRPCTCRGRRSLGSHRQPSAGPAQAAGLKVALDGGGESIHRAAGGPHPGSITSLRPVWRSQRFTPLIGHVQHAVPLQTGRGGGSVGRRRAEGFDICGQGLERAAGPGRPRERTHSRPGAARLPGDTPDPAGTHPVLSCRSSSQGPLLGAWTTRPQCDTSPCPPRHAPGLGVLILAVTVRLVHQSRRQAEAGRGKSRHQQLKYVRFRHRHKSEYICVLDSRPGHSKLLSLFECFRPDVPGGRDLPRADAGVTAEAKP